MHATARRFDWLFLDLNSYFASVEQQMHPELRGKPVAVVPMMSDWTCVIAASYQAKKFGIKTGTQVREAKQKCPGLILVSTSHNHYVEFHNRIIAEVDRHVPVHTVASIDEMACQLTGRWREAEQALQLAHNIKAGIAKNIGECLTSSIGLSSNRFLAKVATDMQKPDGLVCLHPDDLPGAMMALAPRDLPGIGPSMERRLAAAGITTFAALWHCAPKQLRGLWGSVEGERFWYALRGVEIEAEETQRRSVSHSHVLAPAQRPLQLAEPVARRLLLKAAGRLRRLDHLTGCLTVAIRIEHGERLEIHRRFTPVSDSVTLQEQFTAAWRELTAGLDRARLKKVSVDLHELVDARADQQLDLFQAKSGSAGQGDGAVEKRARLSAALDNLTHRFGRDAVTIGIVPGQGSSFSGTKIAFSRVPSQEDFADE